MSEFNLPDLTVTKDVIERIQFSVSSRNAKAKLSECATHVFAAQYSDNPRAIQWQYVASGVACLLRNRELHKNGKKYMWSMNMCLYNVAYGVLVWKAKLISSCDYTAVSDNFHVFALGEVNVVVGLLFSSREHACELNTTYMTWHQERMRDDGKKGPSSVAGGSVATPPSIRFKKEMISKPCNFQHIQGTQALDECLEIEKIKADILAAFFGLGTGIGRAETDSGEQKKKKKKKEQAKSRSTFKEISVPTTMSKAPPSLSEATAYRQQNSYSSQSTPQSLSSPHQSPAFPYPHGGATANGMQSVSPPPMMPDDYASNGYSGEFSQNSQGSIPPPAGSYTNIDSLPSEHGGPTEHYTNIDSLPEHQAGPTSAYTNIDSLPSDQSGQQDYYTNIDSLPNEQGDPPDMYANIESLPTGPTTNYANIDSLPSNEDDPSANYANVGTHTNEQEPPSGNYANFGSLQDGPSSTYANFTNNQGEYSPPPRLDFNLEKELADSFLFQSPLMSAN